MCFRNSLAGFCYRSLFVRNYRSLLRKYGLFWLAGFCLHLCVLRNSLAGSKTVVSNTREDPELIEQVPLEGWWADAQFFEKEDRLSLSVSAQIQEGRFFSVSLIFLARDLLEVIGV